ncbi:hypothetical protein KDH_53600 [Dictyobacter sp. S3.2.2.5]|uniref:Uncharacterized protein n=1 Tax=Dictyobacter halimunensis TaxID=3026934 RepID=A0ABQ6FW86_9CHLR|nr:hypothetical protein KDH_53600 [Dictyobacter sp. S3.2.2.5]
MDVFADPWTHQLFYFTGGAAVIISIVLAIVFGLLRIRKLRLLAEKRPAEARDYNAWLILLNYIIYALPAFICSFLLGSVPLTTAFYVGSLIGQRPFPLLPLITGGTVVGLGVACYVTTKFMYGKMTFEDSLLSSIVSVTH